MDSDENDYHSQDLHLVGEESCKVSSVLCPYALPKFDFDEGSLRFDNLVENEVFLGIQSQDDNQWIEDFSRDSSGINFSSRAPDSCSIPRHNNVWSEATSSESVEMLLKSVGQEDMVLEESVVRDSDTRTELPSSNQMDTNFMHDSKIEDFKESSCGTPPAHYLQDFSTLNKVERKNISSSHGFDQPVDVCAHVGETTLTSIFVTEQNLPVDVKGNDENESKDGSLIGESLIVKIEEDNLAMSCLSSDPTVGSGILNVQNKVPDISSENSGLPVETDIVGVHGASDTSFVLDNGQVARSCTEMHTSVFNSAACVTSETEVLSDYAVQSISNIEQSPMPPPQGNSGLPKKEGCNSEAFTPELAKASVDGCGTFLQSESEDLCGERPCVVINVDDGCSGEQSEVVSEIGNDCGIDQSFEVINNDQFNINPELETDSVVPNLMSGRVMDGDDTVVSKFVDHVEHAEINKSGIHGASDSSLVLDDGKATESPTQMHTSVVLHSAAYVVPETESMSEIADKTTANIEQSPMLPPQDNSTLHTGEGGKSELFSPELVKAALTEDTHNELHSKSNDLSIEKSCAVIKDDDGFSMEQSSEVSEAGNVCGNEQSFAAGNNDQCVIYPELEIQPVMPEVMSGSTSESDNDVFISDNIRTAEVEPAETVQEPHDGIKHNATHDINDGGNPTSELANKNSEPVEAFMITTDSTQSVDHVQPTEANQSLEPSMGMSDERDFKDGDPLNAALELNDETLTSESGNANSESDEATFNRGDITNSADHLESTEGMPSPKLITGMSADQDSIDVKQHGVMQKSSDEILTKDAIDTNFKIVLPVDDGNDYGVCSKNSITEENVGPHTEGPDIGPHTKGETGLDARVVGNGTGSHDEVSYFPPVLVGADVVVKTIKQNEHQASHTMLLEISNPDNEDKEDTAAYEATMEDVNEKMKQGAELHGGQTNVEEVMNEMGHEPCGAESLSSPFFSIAETETMVVNQSMNALELQGGQTNIEQVMTEEAQGPCGAESVSLHSDSVVRERDDAESVDLMNLDEGVIKGSINSVAEHCDSIPVASASAISNKEGKEQSHMTEVKEMGLPSSSDANMVGAKLSDTIPREGVKVTIEKDSSEGAKGTPLEEERTSTFQASLLPKVSSPVEGSHSTYKPGQTDSKVGLETSHASQTHDQRASPGGPKGTSERKSRRSSGKLAKGNPAKGNCLKEMDSKIPSGVGNTLCVVLSPSSSVKSMPLEAGSSAPKPTAIVTRSSNLPDLNTSTSTAVLFRQPFTDLQQVQLRAQIFVYGSLIQGAAPDEAFMVSAFGPSDQGRSVWEPVWRACIQRLQKSHLSNPETPVQSRSAAKASDQVTKKGLSQRKPRLSSNGNSSSVATPIIPLSSPLWNISTPLPDALPTNTVARSPVIDYQALPPFYQTPASRNYSGHTRVSQAPYPVPWMASPQASPYNINVHIAPPQPTDIVKLTTIKSSPAPSPSALKLLSPVSVGQTGHSTVVCGQTVTSYAPHSVEPKSRKRKKVSVSEDLPQIAFPVALGQTEFVSVSVTPAPSVNKSPGLGDLGPSSLPPGVQLENAGSFAANSQVLASVTIPTPPGPGLKSSIEKAIAVVSPLSSVDHPASSRHITLKSALSLDEFAKVEEAKLQTEKVSAYAAAVSPVSSVDRRQNTEKRALSLDEAAKVEEAKLQAEVASAHAAAAVSHCQNLWSQLGKQNSSNRMSDSEAKLSSAAVCIAAAASVAKAASAAAKVASTVALQAKLMADEALISNRCLDSIRNISGFANNTGNATPASIFKAGEGGNGSSSVIYAAREAAKRRVEAASAASKHAENLDAILKAAELAAEAVAHAGKIVALVEPLPLSKLVEGGPAGYWKDPRTPIGMGNKSNIATLNNVLTSVEEHPDPAVDQPERHLDSTSQATVDHVSPDAIEKSKDLIEDQVKEKMATFTHDGELESRKSPAASKMAKTVGVAPEAESGPRVSTEQNMAGVIKESRINVSSPVEVFKDNGDFAGAWFSASVLSLKNGKALVSYKDLETDEGKLTEWVPLEAGIRKPPMIRLVHPMTSLMFDGNRKRRREFIKDCSWSVGDRVDAWLENCWSEGVIVETNKKDDTTLNVHFPAQGKTIAVKAWHLRPSRIWTGGEWIQSQSSENEKSSQGDTPKEKRMKLGSPTVDKITKNMDPPESRKFEDSRLLPLSVKEKSFHIGSTKNDKPESHRTMRSGLQKEGPKVIFGVPKQGKKRKFMDVSKHYVSSQNTTKVNANVDKEKSAKHLVPEGGAFGWKNSSKINNPKEKQCDEPRTQNFKPPTKQPSSFTRTLPQKDKSRIPHVSQSKEGFSTDNAISNDDSGDQYLNNDVSSSNVEGEEEPISSSSRAPHPRAHRKMTPSNAKSERLMKGKGASSAHGNPNKGVEKEKTVPDSSEPRRSNRKIQPTSRLLEGLQSSLIMSKAPLVSHDKSHKGPKFGALRGMRS